MNLKMKRYVMFLALLMAVFIAGNAWAAADDCEVNANSEGIAYQATCDKAGNLSFAFDPDTVLTEGDEFYIDLPFGVTLCREIDLRVYNGAPNTHFVGFTANGLNGDAPFFFTDQSGYSNATSTNGGIYFDVKGTVGQQRVKVTVMADGATGTLTIGSHDNQDDMTLILFDQRINGAVAASQTVFNGNFLFIDSDSDSNYETGALLADNTLCINVSQHTQNTVDASLDSLSDKFTFDPTNPEIAHVMTAVSYTLATCKGTETCGDIPIQGQSSTCEFDFEAPTGYCTTFAGGRLVIQTAATAFENTNFSLTITSGTAGVYFGGAPVVGGFTAAQDNCSGAGAALGETWTAKLGDGTTAGAYDAGTCTPAATSKVVTMTSNNFNPGASNYNAIYLNLGKFVYDSSVLTNGTAANITITLTKAPCSTPLSEVVCVGTFVDACSTGTSTSTTLLFPYFPAMDGSTGWFDGIVIINQSTADGTATLTFYEADVSTGVLNETGTLAVSVPAQGMYIKSLADIVASITTTGTMGDDPLWIAGSCNFLADGFAIMYTSTVAQGYLPRAN